MKNLILIASLICGFNLNSALITNYTTLGAQPKSNVLHSTESFFVTVRGTASNSPYALVNLSNVLENLQLETEWPVPSFINSNEIAQLNGITGLISTNLAALQTQINNRLTNMPGSKTIWLDAVNGNDSTAVRGDAYRPFQTLSNALNAVQDGDIVESRPNYYRSFGLCYTNQSGADSTNRSGAAIRGRQNVRINGNGSVVWTTNHHDLLEIYGSTNIYINGFTFVYSNKFDNTITSNGAAAHIDVRNSSRVTVENCRFYNGHHGIISVQNGNTTDVASRNNYFYGIGFSNDVAWINKDGTCIAAYQGWTSDGDIFEFSLRAFEIENTGITTPRTNIVIRNAIFKRIWEAAIIIFGGNTNLANLTIEGCRYEQPHNLGFGNAPLQFFGTGLNGFRIANNHFDGELWAENGIQVRAQGFDLANGTISGNTLRGFTGTALVVNEDGSAGILTNVVVSGNIIDGYTYGIEFSGRGCDIVNNVITMSALSSGTGILVSTNSGYPHFNRIIGNTIRGGSIGIDFGGAWSSNNIAAFNMIQHYDTIGITNRSTTGNMITNNFDQAAFP